jgi:hypothetical protein
VGSRTGLAHGGRQRAHGAAVGAWARPGLRRARRRDGCLGERAGAAATKRARWRGDGAERERVARARERNENRNGPGAVTLKSVISDGYAASRRT